MSLLPLNILDLRGIENKIYSLMPPHALMVHPAIKHRWLEELHKAESAMSFIRNVVPTYMPE